MSRLQAMLWYFLDHGRLNKERWTT